MNTIGGSFISLIIDLFIHFLYEFLPFYILLGAGAVKLFFSFFASPENRHRRMYGMGFV